MRSGFVKPSASGILAKIHIIKKKKGNQNKNLYNKFLLSLIKNMGGDFRVSAYREIDDSKMNLTFKE